MPRKAYIKTFGCQMNVHDSEKMAGILKGEGYELTDDLSEADLVIYNTCSVREKAEQKFMSDLGRLRRSKDQRPERRIAVAGCMAQQMGGEIFRRAPHVDMVIGPQNYHELAGMLRDAGSNGGRVLTEDNPDIADQELPMLRTEGPRAWISIMYGCNNFCTYCIVPYTRGREKSRPAGSIIMEARGLAGEGRREVTLLGQNVNSYNGGELDFPGLLEALDRIDGLERIRFVTSHPRDLSEGLINAIEGLSSVCEHLHLPMQSGSTRVLEAMNRRYSYEDYLERIGHLRAAVPGIAITTDIIAGFPGETEEDHEMTLNALKDIRFDGIFAFRYSERPGTRASGMDGQIPVEERLRRLNEILGAQEDITSDINQALVGKTLEILIEGPSESDPSRLTGRTRTNKIVNFVDKSNRNTPVGSLIKVRIVRAQKHSLEGEPCE